MLNYDLPDIPLNFNNTEDILKSITESKYVLNELKKKEEQAEKVIVNKPEAFKLSKDKIIQPKIQKPSFFGIRKFIYVGFLLFFSLSIFLASIKNTVIKAYPFLKVYLNIVKILVMKLFKILGLS